MEKKVLKRGYCTSLISLPRDWIKRNQVHFGDRLELDVKNKEIVIRKKGRDKIFVINASKVGEWRTHYFSQIYQRGFTNINFNNVNNAQKQMVKDNLWNFPYTKIIRESDKKLWLEVEDTKTHPFVLLKELFRVSFAYLDLVIEGLKSPSKSIVEKCKKDLREIYALDELVTRKINTEVPETESYYLHNIPASLLFICRALNPCVKYAFKRKVKVSAEIFRFLDWIKEYLRLHYNSRYRGTKINFRKHLELRYKLHYDTLEKHDLFDNIKKEEMFIVEKVIYAARLTTQIYSRNTMFVDDRIYNK